MSNLEHVITNYEHQKGINLFNDLQVNYLRGTALNISSSTYLDLFLKWICYLQKMMCNFVARTNRSNIESNYFMHTIIVFDLPNYTNVTNTVVTFINQTMLCHTFVLFLPENDLHKSGAIYQINLYVFLFTQKFLTVPTSLTMWDGRPSFKTNRSQSHMAEWIIFAITGISVCSSLIETPFTAIVLNGFLSLMKGSSSSAWSRFPSFFLDLVWQTKLPSLTASFQ